ncbi:carbohydrate binding family 9 domain-containing protein [Pleionea sp. CnH1-48]|uniref:carbohydrate binding family 9 domain-containing protein n=1 Tax=Pleionea sp. CnH1-48 TaxID=2954494 RepID=UPI00209846FF|nr:DUF5916 domain-containing protein [Pleionea sp. CnH1-48]MCO7227175.1 carbohydrate binding family 9 domain-containing protein [Pleionea sp. CnH1-48]
MRSFYTQAFVGLIGLLSVGTTPLFAQQKAVNYTIPHIEEKPSLDGEMNEAAWQRAHKTVLGYETDPGENIPAKVKTTAYYYEDGANLYVAFVAEDPQVGELRAFFHDRDQSWSDDNVSIIIDTFNDERRAYQFLVNPLGVQWDILIDDVVGNEDSSWDAIWDSAGKVNDKGYVVEMAIPLRALRFNESLDNQTWGIEFVRFYPRDQRHRFSSMTRQRSIACNLCQLEKISGFGKISAAKNFDVTPTLTLSDSERRDDVNSPWTSDGTDSEAGVDLRWGITQDLYLNATVNPDFSQVETDSAQLSVNNTFSLFFPEKRPFFLDGADYFNSPNRLVHTRNIADPDFGVKLTGKTDQNSYGVIFANDTNTSFLLPRSLRSHVVSIDDTESDIAVLRWRRDVGEKNSIGALVTHRSADNYENNLLAVDGRYWFSDTDNLRVQLMSSETEYPDEVQQEYGQEASLSDNALSLSYNHNDREWDWGAFHRDFGKGFRADLGFITQVDARKSGFSGRRKWRANEGLWTYIDIYSDYDITHDDSGRKIEEEVEIWLNIDGIKQSAMWFGGGRRERFFAKVATDGSESGGTIYFENFMGAGFGFRPIPQLLLELGMNFGDRVDTFNNQLGQTHEFRPRVEWQVNEHLKLKLRHILNWLDVDGGELLKAKITELKGSYQFNIRHQLKFTLQMRDIDFNLPLFLPDEAPDSATDRKLGRQLIYSYKVNPQTLFFAGYSDLGYQDDSLNSIESREKTFFAKFSYAFQL